MFDPVIVKFKVNEFWVVDFTYGISCSSQCFLGGGMYLPPINTMLINKIKVRI